MSVGERIDEIMKRDGVDRAGALKEFWNEFNEQVRPCILGPKSLHQLITEEMRICIADHRLKDRSMFPEALAARAMACVGLFLQSI